MDSSFFRGASGLMSCLFFRFFSFTYLFTSFVTSERLSRVPLALPRNTHSSSVILVGRSKMLGVRGFTAPFSSSTGARRLRLRASLISRCMRFSSFFTWLSMADTVSRRVFRLPVTAFRSSSRVVAGTTGAAAAASTGVELTTTFAAAGAAAAAFLAATFLGAAAAAASGAATTTGAGAATSFFATAFLAGGADLEATAAFIIPEAEEEEVDILRNC